MGKKTKSDVGIDFNLLVCLQSLKTSCKGKYVNIDPSNVECLRHYETYKKVCEIIKYYII